MLNLGWNPDNAMLLLMMEFDTHHATLGVEHPAAVHRLRMKPQRWLRYQARGRAFRYGLNGRFMGEPWHVTKTGFRCLTNFISSM